MLRAYKYRLYPTAKQREFLAQQFGNVRRVYNLALDMRCMFWIGAKLSISRFATQAQLVEWKEMYLYLALSNSIKVVFMRFCAKKDGTDVRLNLQMYIYIYKSATYSVPFFCLQD